MSEQNTYHTQIYHAVRVLKREQNLSDEEVIRYFVKKGVKRATAEANLALFYGVEQRRRRKNAFRDIGSGIMIVLAGIAINNYHSGMASSPLWVQAVLPAAGVGLLIYGVWRYFRRNS